MDKNISERLKQGGFDCSGLKAMNEAVDLGNCASRKDRAAEIKEENLVIDTKHENEKTLEEKLMGIRLDPDADETVLEAALKLTLERGDASLKDNVIQTINAMKIIHLAVHPELA
jgi:hypothetical protein